MKKILFVINSLTIGGSEKSLVSLLSLIDYSKYQIDLLMFKRGEEFDKYIPREVNILDIPKYYKFIEKKINNISTTTNIKYLSCRLKTSIKIRVNSISRNSVNIEQILYKSQKDVLENLKEEYDVAIAYSQGMPTYFVVDKVKAKKKFAWINCDYSTTKYDKEFDYGFYKNIDKIVAVSNTIRESIISLKPEYEKKIEVILDIVNPDLIQKMAKEESCCFNKDKYIKIVTVARLVIHHKGYDIAVKAAKLLKDNGYKFKWFVIGDGPDRKKIECLISEYNLTDNFILLGKKDNPYPYMKLCDIYVQPSKKEGFGLTVVEAKILGRPIVCTNFNTANELISNEIDGIIVKMNENSVYEGIRKYIDDINFKIRILNNLAGNERYNSTNEVYKFNCLVD